MYTFLNLYYLFILIPIFLLVFYLYKKWWKNIVFWDVNLLKEVFSKNSLNYKIYYTLIFLIFIFFSLIFSNFVLKEDITKENKNGIDIVISMDVSTSMLATDLKPNRLEVSKNILQDFIIKLNWDRLWLIVFAWKPFTSLPLNFDYEVSNSIISKINTEIIDSRLWWTSIWDSIILASENFDEKSKNREKVIILITDWDDNSSMIDPKSAVNLLKKENKNIKIYTIGIWWKDKAFIESKDFFGRIVKQEVWALNEELLRYIANSTNWIYFRATDEKSLENIFEEISKLEKKDLENEEYTIYNEKNIYFVYLLIFLFLILFLFKFRKNI